MVSYSAFQRQWRILQYIAGSSDGATLCDLAKQFNVCPKTIRRDLKLLQSIPFSLREEVLPHNNKRKYFFDFSQGLFPLNLTFDELLALYVGRHLMQPLKGTYFWDAIQTGFKKIRQVLRPSVIAYAERVSPLFFQLDRGMFDYSEHKKQIDTILESMEDHRVIEIRYKSVKSAAPKTYRIHPYHFVYHQGFLYVIGWSCKDEEIRFWKINRFLSVRLLDFSFEIVSGFNIKAYMAKAFCPFVSEKGTVVVRLLFRKVAAPGVREMAWDSFRKMSTRRDGSLEVELEAENGKPLLHWVLGFGGDVEVLSPPEFRKEFCDKISSILARYQIGEDGPHQPDPLTEDTVADESGA